MQKSKYLHQNVVTASKQRYYLSKSLRKRIVFMLICYIRKRSALIKTCYIRKRSRKRKKCYIGKRSRNRTNDSTKVLITVKTLKLVRRKLRFQNLRSTSRATKKCDSFIFQTYPFSGQTFDSHFEKSNKNNNNNKRANVWTNRYTDRQKQNKVDVKERQSNDVVFG